MKEEERKSSDTSLATGDDLSNCEQSEDCESTSPASKHLRLDKECSPLSKTVTFQEGPVDLPVVENQVP